MRGRSKKRFEVGKFQGTTLFQSLFRFSSSSLLYLGREREAVVEVLSYFVDMVLLLFLSRGLLLFELEGQGESGVGIGFHLL